MTESSIELLTTAMTDEWRSQLPASRSVFGSVEFARITEKQYGYTPKLLTCKLGTAKIAYPLFLRPTYLLPIHTAAPAALWDTLSPEYSGPLLVSDDEIDGAEFQEIWNRTCGCLGIVAEFAHLHPWKAQLACLDSQVLVSDREIVYIDVTEPPERLLKTSFSYACRKNLRRAQSEGLEVYFATDADDIREFHRIYTATMTRNHALVRYFYPLEYFLAFFEEMPNNALFVMARHESKTIAATLYLYDNTDVYSYLGGTDYEYQQMRPSNVVVFEAIRWAHTAGRQRLILGGGYKPDDGIFRFKASFSPLRACFSVYRKVHMPSAYESMCRAWAAQSGLDIAAATYFPAYRTPMSTIEA
jgi:serine/alanine adding enzyme